MKKIILLFSFYSVVCVFDTKAATDMCPGSGAHCAVIKGEATMSGVKFTYDVVVYKGKDKPAAIQ
jgi:hypothetical protein